MIEPLIDVILGSTMTATPPPTTDFWSSQLFGVILGGIISAVVSFVGSWIIYKQQQTRDRDAFDRQVKREDIAYDRQKEREMAAYIRSLKDAKRERLRAAYKVILNAAETHKQVVESLPFPLFGTVEEHKKRLYSLLSESLTGVDDAMDEVSLEGEELGLKAIFTDMNIAYQTYERDLDINERIHGQVRLEELTKTKERVTEKAEELKSIMRRHLKELEQ